MKSSSKDLRNVFAIRSERSAPSSSRRLVPVTFRFASVLIVSLFASWLLAQENADTTEITDSMIVVVGAPGAEEFEGEFRSWSKGWRELAERNRWRLQVIGESDSDGQTPREQLEAAFKAQVERDERLWIILLGHGTFSKGVAKFNLVGPDVSSAELKSWLTPVKAETIVVDCSSSSAPFLTDLSARNRIVVTATRSGSEINFARFGGFLAQTITDLTADIDHDESISLLEAFLAASSQTERFYMEEARLATEHALLDDNGDQTGTPADFYRGVQAVKASQDGKQADGPRAARVILFSSPDVAPFSEELAAQREAIENEIDALRSQKTLLDEQEYYDKLETLLLSLAKLYDIAEQPTSLGRGRE